MYRAIAISLLFMCPLSFAQSSGQAGSGPDAGEQQAIDQLRSIAEGIKACRLPEIPVEIFSELASEGFKDVYGPPLNVVWDAKPQTSLRSRYVGSIEFSEPSYMQMPPNSNYCNKPKLNKSMCKERYEAGVRLARQQMEHPLQFKYEFDVMPSGLELREVFRKGNRTNDDPWVPGDVSSDACASRAIRSVQTKVGK